MHGDAFNAESAELMQDISLPTSIGTGLAGSLCGLVGPARPVWPP